MTDTELQMLAGKAAGLDVNLEVNGSLSLWEDDICVMSVWEPLEDDGDAFRLAVTLNLNHWLLGGYTATDFTPEWAICEEGRYKSYGRIRVEEFVGGDPRAATRRAIVRAAAAIERSKHDSI